ncbi:ANTAR domain-containing response regulator [Chakrabartyella piscis]|uniref:ANTAR domain-containing response regulator n=1 Tax=Chakrabartyella piscis TaxID=2918914 RepID=UPI002958343E|nr:ANTAR domain-containing protein [Chakrabartyella piscis]
MEHILVVDSGEKTRTALAEYLQSNFHFQVSFATNGAEARRKLGATTYAIVMVNAPLGDEFGNELLIQASKNTGAGLILLAKNEQVPELEVQMNACGVMTVGKPLQKEMCNQSVRMALGIHFRMSTFVREKQRMQKKLEDVKMTEKAKFVLMQQKNISENEAHKILEKRAMDLRMTKREVAEDILENFA